MAKKNTNAQPSLEDLMAQIAQLQQENAELKTTRKGSAPAISCKVGNKGGVSVYGLGRFPVTLYGSQWVRFLEAVPSIASFCRDNAEKLTVKDGEDKEILATSLRELAARYAQPGDDSDATS